MRILILASRPLEHSGITKIEMDVINRIAGSADIIVACSFGFDNEYGRELRKRRIRRITLPPKDKVYRYMLAIASLIKKEKIDEVYIHGNSAMMIFEALPSKIAGAKTITHCHNTKTDHAIIHYIAKPLFNFVVDEKIGVSELASSWAYAGKRITTITNGVDLSRFHLDLKSREDVRTKLCCNDKHVYGHVGAFNRQKNHIRLLHIFKAILEIDKDAVLLLIGDGELEKQIINLANELDISEKVLFMGFIQDLEKYYQAMDVMIMPSLHEGLCLAAMEAQACGVPVLISDVFAKETLVTDTCKSLSLKSQDMEWAKMAVSMLNHEREDKSDVFLKKGMDYDTMMEKIVQIILK